MRVSRKKKSYRKNTKKSNKRSHRKSRRKIYKKRSLRSKRRFTSDGAGSEVYFPPEIERQIKQYIRYDVVIVLNLRNREGEFQGCFIVMKREADRMANFLRSDGNRIISTSIIGDVLAKNFKIRIYEDEREVKVVKKMLGKEFGDKFLLTDLQEAASI